MGANSAKVYEAPAELQSAASLQRRLDSCIPVYRDLGIAPLVSEMRRSAEKVAASGKQSSVSQERHDLAAAEEQHEPVTVSWHTNDVESQCQPSFA